MMKGSPISSAAFSFISRRSSQSQRQLACWPGTRINKISEMLGHGLARNVAPRLNLLSDIFRNVVCPMLQGIEGYNANRIIELSSHKIADNGFEVRSLGLSLAVNAAAAKAINYQICRLIRTIRHSAR
jgi:hypothetical protein